MKDVPTIILAYPQMGENIGAAARAMLNFGLKELRLVAPRDGWPNERAEAMAAGAFAEMEAVRIFETLPEAIADLQYVLATTARPRDMVKPVFTPALAVAEGKTREDSGQKIGFVFGGERAGLTNDDVSLCQGIVTIPTNPAFPALNLGQSVLLMAYEWVKAAPAPALVEKNNPATQTEVQALLERLAKELDESGLFFRAPDLKPTMLRNIRNVFTRGDLTSQEVRTLQGIISALRGK